MHMPQLHAFLFKKASKQKNMKWIYSFRKIPSDTFYYFLIFPEDIHFWIQARNSNSSCESYKIRKLIYIILHVQECRQSIWTYFPASSIFSHSLLFIATVYLPSSSVCPEKCLVPPSSSLLLGLCCTGQCISDRTLIAMYITHTHSWYECTFK